MLVVMIQGLIWQALVVAGLSVRSTGPTVLNSWRVCALLFDWVSVQITYVVVRAHRLLPLCMLGGQDPTHFGLVGALWKGGANSCTIRVLCMNSRLRVVLIFRWVWLVCFVLETSV